jgi:hypothetical protein
VSCRFTEHADINAAGIVLRAGLAKGGNEAYLVNAEPVSRSLAFARIIARRALIFWPGSGDVLGRAAVARRGS